MAGTARIVSYVPETQGFGGFPTTLSAAASAGATSLTLNGAGGVTVGVAPVVVGLWVYFLDTIAEAPKLITAVSVTGGNATVTIAALTNAIAANQRILVAPKTTTTLLLDKLSLNRNQNNWSSNPYSGSAAKNNGRQKGRIEADGAISFSLRPSVNMPILVKAIGSTNIVSGTIPGTPVNTTLSAIAAVGSSTVTVASATGLAVNNIVQLGSGTSAECRKITAIASTTLTLDMATRIAHASGDTVALVIAPFLRDVYSRTNDVDSITIEDYVPYEDPQPGNPNKLTGQSYLATGVKAKSLKVSSNSETGIMVDIDVTYQEKWVIPASTGLLVPTENMFSYDMIQNYINAARNYRVETFEYTVDNDPQKRYTQKGDTLPFAIKAGQQDLKGSFKFYEDTQTQISFWAAWTTMQAVALQTKVQDKATNYYVQLTIPRAFVDDFKDSDFGPNDLVDAEVPFTGTLDSATNGQVWLELSNGDYLPY